MITDPFATGGGNGPRLPLLLLVTAAALAAAYSEAWASALTTAAAVHAVLANDGQGGRG